MVWGPGEIPMSTATAAFIARFTFLGTTDEVTTCDCCGKADLKLTVAIMDDERGETLYFGTTCAARALKIGVKEVKAGAAAADRAKAEARRAEQAAKHAAEMSRWRAYLIARTGGINDFAGQPCIGAMIQALGGFAAARAGYEAA